MTVRRPAVAGAFYPNKAKELREMVDTFYRDASSIGEAPKAIIAPHAGYVYSGKVAAAAYAPLEKVAKTIRKVVLIGPAHRKAFDGLAFPACDEFETPLGNVKLNMRMVNYFYNTPFVIRDDQPHRQEHSLEVHVPFLQMLIPNFELIPILVGRATVAQVTEVLESVWGGPETLIVVSSDLSHYHDYPTAQSLDKTTTQNILDRNVVLKPEDACGSRPINALLNIANKLGLEGRLVEQCNSGDTAGSHDKSRVVGYAAYHFGSLSMQDMTHSPELKQELLSLARNSIKYGLDHGDYMPNFSFPSEFNSKIPRATFVTIKKGKDLRGCIGTLQPYQALPLDVMRNAYKAAFKDERFKPLQKEEWKDIAVSISILSPPAPMVFVDEADLVSQLVPFEDGLILEDGENRGTFLPAVWESYPEPQEFFNHLKNKAGLPMDYWSSSIQVKRYKADAFGDEILH